MKKLTLTIAIILLIIVGGGIYLDITSDKINLIEKLGKIFQEEEKEPDRIIAKELIKHPIA